MRILLVSPYLPHERIGHGGGQAVRSLLRILSSRHDCLLLSLMRPGEEDFAASIPRQLGCGLITVPFLDRHARSVDRAKLYTLRFQAIQRSLHDRYPYYAAKYADRALFRAAIEASSTFKPDIIQVEYLQLAYLLRELRRWRDMNAGHSGDHGPRLILDSHEVGSLPRRRRAARAGFLHRRHLLIQAAAWDRLARDATGWADATLCVTEQDRHLLAAAGGRRLVTVPLGIDIPDARPEGYSLRQRRILFLGSFQHPPNRSAAALLCDRIWPGVADRLCDWELVLAGPGSDTFLATRLALPPRIRATGYVDDLETLFNTSRLFAAPLTDGGGIKIKILESMARGLPVVTTPIGAEGIVTDADDMIWLAPDAERFADYLVDAARNPEEAARRADCARRFIKERYSWESIVERLESVYRNQAVCGPD